MDILYELAVASEKRCNETALLIEDHKQKASEYQADGRWRYMYSISRSYCIQIEIRTRSIVLVVGTK